jgi:pimeloyl-ACP methyl ester carboxylesterase
LDRTTGPNILHPSGNSSRTSQGAGEAVSAPSAAEGLNSIITTSVSFTVQNVNHSKLACPSDGGTYHVVGTLVTPAEVPKSVTLWMHNAIGDRNTFMVPIRNYHFANEMAKLGHAGLYIDQLGYGKSDKPSNGHLVCPGSEATAMYQVMEHLRSGDYQGDSHPAFEKVAVGGFSIGAWQAELIGVSFPHVDGIIPIGGMSAFVSSEAPPDVVDSMSRECSTGSYFHFATAEKRNYWAIYEPNVDKDVEDWWTKNSYGADPCGIWEWIMASTATVDAVGPTANPDLKVLVVLGDKDRILPPPNGHLQVARFFNSHDVSLLTMPNTGHAVMLERNAPMFRQQLHLWMVQRGL